MNNNGEKDLKQRAASAAFWLMENIGAYSILNCTGDAPDEERDAGRWLITAIVSRQEKITTHSGIIHFAKCHGYKEQIDDRSPPARSHAR